MSEATYKIDRKKIIENLVKLRGNRTQAEFADFLGVSVSSVGMWETGKRIPSDDVKVLIAKKTHKSVQSIFFA